MKRILVPTDFSDCAKNASEAAIQIAQKSQAEICYLHMMGVPTDWIGTELEESKLYSSVTKAIKEADYELDLEVKKAEDNGITAKKFLQYSVSFKDLLSYIEKTGADFVVMGSHGVSGVGEFLVGSNTQKMARYCNVPLLVINKPIDQFEVKNIVYSSDLDVKKSFFHDQVKSFADIFDAKVHGLYVNTPYYFVDTPMTEQKVEDFCASNPELFDSFTTYNFRNEDEGILHFCKDVDADVVVLVTEGKTGIARAFDRSITETVIRYAKIPVLSLNMHD